MIRAVIFDLDGTLVKTEQLKALSYARAAVELCPFDCSEDQIIEAFKEVVGLPRREVAEALVRRFNLEAKSRSRMAEFGVGSAWQAYVQVRLRYYEAMIADPETILAHRWPHNLELLEEARDAGYALGLATMSHCAQARHVLEVIGLDKTFDFVATRDDVEHGKPDPEIYVLVSRELNVFSRECLVLEDSPSGVRAALAAGMACIAVTTPFTREGVHASGLLEERWIIDDPAQGKAVMRQMIEEHANKG